MPASAATVAIMLGFGQLGVAFEIAFPVGVFSAFSPLVAWIVVYHTREAKRQGWGCRTWVE